MALSIQHQAQNQQFVVTQNGHSAKLAYHLPAPSVIDFTHTFVDEPLRGQGIGEELAKAGLAYARDEHLKVRASCSFVRGYVAQHLEQQDLLEA